MSTKEQYLQFLREKIKLAISWPGLPLVLAIGDAIAWTALCCIWWRALP